MAKKALATADPADQFPDSSIVFSLLKSLSIVSDPRKDRGKRHLLSDILAIAVLGSICNCDNAEALADWAEKEQDWLSGFLQLPHGTPSQDVFLRVFASIKPQQFQQAFHDWVQGFFEQMGTDGQIAIDGQTNRGSRQRSLKKGPIHMVSALACGQGLVLGQVKTDEKSNEITAIPELLKMLNIQNALVSIDAMGCQVSIAEQITEAGGDYLLGLKGNQGKLHQETQNLFEATDLPYAEDMREALVSQDSTSNKGHGRKEQRTARIVNDFDGLVPSAKRWPHLQSLVAIDSVRTDVISGKQTHETRYYISSKLLTPAEAIASTRSHWEIENKLHWCLDVTFGQDANQTRVNYAAENLAVVRHIALNIIRSYNGDRYTMARRRRMCDYKLPYRKKLLGLA